MSSSASDTVEAPPSPSQRGWVRLRAGLWLWALGAGFLLLYLLTLYPGVGGRINPGDSAKWQFIGHIGGISHPPGSPLYVLLTWLWSRLPIAGTIALRVNAFSALCGTLAVVLLALAARRLTGSRLAAAIAASLVGLGPTFWSQATEAEVYALYLAFAAGVLLLALRWRDERRPRDLHLAALLCGLGFPLIDP